MRPAGLSLDMRPLVDRPEPHPSLVLERFDLVCDLGVVVENFLNNDLFIAFALAFHGCPKLVEAQRLVPVHVQRVEARQRGLDALEPLDHVG